jgi:hypothetical protein
MTTATKRARARMRAARWMATPTKRERARAARGIAGRGLATATLVTGNEKGNGGSGYGQWLRQRGWQAFDGGNNGGGAKDTAARVTTGERGIMVATGHGLCVCFGVYGV